jgi:beta-galactosidase
MRQNMNFDDPVFRRYAERMIRALVVHYRRDPAVIGWQLDNETGPNGAANDSIFQAFVEHLKRKFGTPEALDRAWFLNYWGQAIHDWSDMPRPDFTVSPSYKLEWARFQQQRVTDYLAWQAQIVRGLRRPDQYVLHDFASAMRTDVDEAAIAPALDVVGINVYHASQDQMDGAWQAMEGDYARSLKRQNYFVTETSAQTIGWNSSGEFPPFDGQLRLDAYANVASGANMLLYWHWASLHAGLESYWKGVLGHDLQPGRAYAEVARTGAELKRLGPDVANLRVPAKVAILYSVDSSNALNFMPYRKEPSGDWQPEQTSGYMSTLRQLHRALYQADMAVDFLPADAPAQSLSRYSLLVIPSLYVADNPTLERIAAYVHAGGHVLATFKSGVANEDDAIRWERLPGPLREVAGFSYQEFTSLKTEVALKGDPFEAGSQGVALDWAEFLVPTTAQVLARYDDPVIGRWPAVTRNRYGQGTFTYEGSAVSDRLQYAIVRRTLEQTGLAGILPSGPGAVRTRRALDAQGRTLRFIMNFSSDEARYHYPYREGTDLLSKQPVTQGADLAIPAWDLRIIRER